MKTQRQLTTSASGVAQDDAPLSPLRAFVVQFREGQDGSPVHFVGRAEHVTSGQVIRFRSRAELWRFFASVLTAQGVGRSVETGGVACIPSRAPPTRYT